MITINDKIRELSAIFDSYTASSKVDTPLELVGPADSVFLKSIQRKADKLGVPCKIVDRTVCDRLPVVIDTENAVVADNCPSYKWDVDSVTSKSEYALPSVTQACFELISRTRNLNGLTVTIVGRGHAVKGLAQQLIEENATVTVAHSYTKNLMHACLNQDVVVYATPELTQEIPYDTKQLVIDLGNCVPRPDLYKCEYTNRIGQLTTSILLYRVACEWGTDT